MKIKFVLKKWLFSEEIKEISKILDSLDRINESNEFLIEQGRKVCQYQINNPNQKMMFRTLTGHGLQTAANHLKLNNFLWQRQFKHETRLYINRSNAEGRILRSKEKS